MAAGVEVYFNSTRWPLALLASSVLHWKCKHFFILTRYYGLKPLHSFYFCLRTLMSCQQTYLKPKHKRKSPLFTNLLFYNESRSVDRHTSILLVSDQLDAQFLLLYVYLNPLHFSSNSVLILRRTIVLI
jgi:hypothetical protein